MWLLEHAVAVNGCQCWMEAVRFAGTATAEASIALTSTSSNKGDSVGGGRTPAIASAHPGYSKIHFDYTNRCYTRSPMTTNLSTLRSNIAIVQETHHSQ